MSETRVVNIKHEPDAVERIRSGEWIYIGRPVPRYGLGASPWANPYHIGPDGTREEVIAQYYGYISTMLTRADWQRALEELRGRTLVCWCAPKLCHGHVLLELLGEA